MRQIKFRAWDRNKKEWSRMIVGRQLAHENFMEMTIPENEHLELMQFTGLKDKNGQEIYEGDILVYKKILYEVSYLDKKSGTWRKKKRANPKEELHSWEVFFSTKGQWCMRRGDQGKSLHGNHENHEVVGNIYENPELIK